MSIKFNAHEHKNVTPAIALFDWRKAKFIKHSPPSGRPQIIILPCTLDF